MGEVLCDRGLSWQHELVSGALSKILAGDFAGEASSDSLVACLQLKCQHPLQPCVPFAIRVTVQLG